MQKLNAESLLAGYLEQDIELRRLETQYRNSLLEQQKTAAEQSFSLQLATGTMSVQNINDTVRFKIEPSLTASIPIYNGLDVSVTVPYTTDGTQNNVADVTASVTAGILGSEHISRNVTLLKTERAVLEAKRAFENQSKTAEKEFYQNLVTLYQAAAQVMSAKDDLFEDELAMQTVKTRGYTATSTTYRTAELDVQTSTQAVTEAIQTYNQLYVLFLTKCGIQPVLPENTELAPLPDSIPADITRQIHKFMEHLIQEDFVSIENALWNRYIGSLERKIDTDFALGASGGFTWKNEDTADLNTADIGLTFSWHGITAKAGVSIPVSTDKNTPSPVFTLSAAWIPNTTKIKAIEKKQKTLDAELEELDIKDAEQMYSETITAIQQTVLNLEHQKKTNDELYLLRKDLRAEIQKRFALGMVSELEYRQAETNETTAKLQCLTTDANIIITFIELQLLFVSDKAA